MQMAENEFKNEATTPLERLPTLYIKDYGYVPAIFVNAAYVIKRNLRTKNLFQTKGDDSIVLASLMMKQRKGKLKKLNVNDVVEAMKVVLVNLSDSLLPNSVCNALIKASQENSMSQYVFVLEEFQHASPYHFAILHYVMHLLKKIAKHSEYNGMNASKLAAIFVLDVIRPMEQESINDGQFMAESLQRLPFLIAVIEKLIMNVDIFKMVCSLDGAGTSTKSPVCSLNGTSASTKSPVCSLNGAGTSTKSPVCSLDGNRTPITAMVSYLDGAGTPIKAIMCSLDGADASTKEVEQLQRNTESWIKSKESTLNKCTKNLLDPPGHNGTPPQLKELTGESGATPFIGIANYEDIRVYGSSNKTKDVLTAIAPAEGNTFVLQDNTRELQAHIENNTNYSPTVSETKISHAKSRKKLKIVSSVKTPVTSKKSMKADKAQTSPHNKSPKIAPKKKSTSSSKKKKKKSGSPVKKENIKQEDTDFSVGSRVSHVTTGQQKEEISLWSFASSATDDNRVMTTTVTKQRTLASTISSPKKLKPVAVQESMRRQHKLERSEMLTVSQELFTDTSACCHNLMSVNSNEAITTDKAHSSSTRITGSTQGEISKIPVIHGKVCSHDDTISGKRCITFADSSSNTEEVDSSSLEVSRASAKEVPQGSESNKEPSPSLKFSVSREGRHRISISSAPQRDNSTREDIKSSVRKLGKNTQNSKRPATVESGNMRDSSQINGTTEDVGVTTISNYEDVTRDRLSQVNELPTRGDPEFPSAPTSPQNLFVTVTYDRRRIPARQRKIRHPNTIVRSVRRRFQQSEPTNTTVLLYSLGNWFFDMFLVFIILCCIFLLLKLIESNNSEDEWIQELRWRFLNYKT